jgi:ABC-type dipeptide/oligopeptide/nickel transport system permease subunit
MRSKLMRSGPLILLGVPLLVFTLWGMARDPFAMTLSKALASPTAALPFGADHLGRDILARVAHGLFQDMRLSFAVVGASALIGVSLGLIAGYAAGWFDHLLILVMDAVLSLPHIILAMVIMLYLSYSPQALVFALVLPGWVKYTRIIRAQVMALKETDFIVYEKVLGAGFFWICFRHLLPNVILPVVGLCALHLGHTLLSVAALGFLGLGLQPPSPEWGTMIMEAKPYIMRAPWTAVFPGIFIFAFIYLFTWVGHCLEKAIQTEMDAAHAFD